MAKKKRSMKERMNPQEGGGVRTESLKDQGPVSWEKRRKVPYEGKTQKLVGNAPKASERGEKTLSKRKKRERCRDFRKTGRSEWGNEVYFRRKNVTRTQKEASSQRLAETRRGNKIGERLHLKKKKLKPINTDENELESGGETKGTWATPNVVKRR